MKQIAILGSGEVGKTLAEGFLKNGYTVCLGTGHPDKLNEWRSQQGKNLSVASFADAAKFGDLLVLAVKGDAALNVLDMVDSADLDGKTIIDATNPIEPAPPENGVLKFFTSINQSLMEVLQKAHPNAHFVKAYNSVGAGLMINPDFGGARPTMFICGNNTDAKKEVTEINTLFGFDTEDMGAVEAARAIEPLCLLWCIPGFLRNEWEGHAFKLLRKQQ
ncbi:MAG: NAD(P)-binding domain-containing protein [Bacteroidetes bacterium]|nr:NAD(P)-binding domain-containing protein [Bacteroidota bacterium]